MVSQGTVVAARTDHDGEISGDEPVDGGPVDQPRQLRPLGTGDRGQHNEPATARSSPPKRGSDFVSKILLFSTMATFAEKIRGQNLSFVERSGPNVRSILLRDPVMGKDLPLHFGVNGAVVPRGSPDSRNAPVRPVRCSA